MSSDEDDTVPQVKSVVHKVQKSQDSGSGKPQDVKPELKAALSSAIPVEKTSVFILPDLAEDLKGTWQTPLDLVRVDKILARIHFPDYFPDYFSVLCSCVSNARTSGSTS